MAGTGKRYTEEQIIAILKKAESAPTVAEVIRRHGVTPHTYYRWKAKFAGMDVSEARRLKSLEDENRRLKRIVADQTLNNRAKSLWTPSCRSPRASWRRGASRLSGQLRT
jgi:putative transposase